MPFSAWQMSFVQNINFKCSGIDILKFYSSYFNLFEELNDLACSRTLANTSKQHQTCELGFFSKLLTFLLSICSLYLRPTELFIFVLFLELKCCLICFLMCSSRWKIYERERYRTSEEAEDLTSEREVWSLELFSTLGHSLSCPNAKLDPDLNWSVLNACYYSLL